MKIIASGTFDRLHEGHKHFLMKAFAKGHVLIGLTSENMVKTKLYAEKIQDYETRKGSLVKFLEEKGKVMDTDYQIIEIDDHYGFALASMEPDAIAVTSETLKNALEINEKRAELGVFPLEIIEVDLIIKDNKKISSSNLRKLDTD